VTESEWHKSVNTPAMIAAVRDKGSDRLWRLFAVACVRTVADRLNQPESGAALSIAERVADGTVSATEWREAREQAAAAAQRAGRAAWEAETDGQFHWGTEAYQAMCEAEALANAALECLAESVDLERIPQGLQLPDLLREVFGNPFHWRIADTTWQSWNSGVIWSLANSIYAESDFVRLPHLADALEEAGCTDAELLSHLRGPGPHVRGCWALDLILGKS
jgi:hypothetical protein